MKDLTHGNLAKNFILFSIPCIFSGLLSQTYNLVDTVITGKFIGETGLGAIGATSPFISLLSSLFWGFGVGVGILCAKQFGAGEYRRLHSLTCGMMIFTSAVTLLISALSIALRDPLMDLLHISDTIRHEATLYFCIYIAGLLFFNINWLSLYYMNAMGASAFPLITSAISCAINITGNLLSVAVFGWGIVGVAVSSVVAGAAVALANLLKLHRMYRQLGVVGAPLQLRGFGRETLAYALPSMFQQVAIYLASAGVSPLVNGIGASASAAYNIAMHIYNLCATVYQRATQVISNFISQSIGAKKPERIYRGIYTGFYQAIAVLLPVLLLCVLFPEAVCSLFFKANTSTESIQYSVLYLQSYLPFIFLNVVNNVFHAILKGSKSTRLLVVSSALGCVARIGCSYLLAESGIRGIYLAWVLSWAIEAVFAVVLFVTKRWESEELHRLRTVSE